MTNSERVRFPGLQKEAFQHPLDREAITQLKKLPYIEDVIRYCVSKTDDMQAELEMMSTMIRVDENQCPDLYDKYVHLARTLDVQTLPSLYISNKPERGAYTTGVEKFVICLHSGLVDCLEEDELLAVLAHELGHVKCDHVMYSYLIHHLLNLGSRSGGIKYLGKAASYVASGRLGEFVDQVSPALLDGMGALAKGLVAARGSAMPLVWEWQRKAELSCDRASLLAIQNPEVVARALVKTSGFSSKYAISVGSAVRQAERCEEMAGESFFGTFFKSKIDFDEDWFVNGEGEWQKNTHPTPIFRIKEILNWGMSNQYKQILKGVYRRAGGSESPADPKSVLCPKCAWLSGVDESFCGSCRTSLREGRIICGNCREEVDDDWAACMHCGSWLDGRGRASGQ